MSGCVVEVKEDDKVVISMSDGGTKLFLVDDVRLAGDCELKDAIDLFDKEGDVFKSTSEVFVRIKNDDVGFEDVEDLSSEDDDLDEENINSFFY